MIRHDNTSLFSAIGVFARRLKRTVMANLTIVRQRIDCRRLRWIVTTNIVCLNDICYFDNIRIYHPGKKEKLRPGLLGLWCLKSCRGRFRQINYEEWAFSSEQDARLFDLLWGSGKDNPDYKRFDIRNRPSSAA